MTQFIRETWLRNRGALKISLVLGLVLTVLGVSALIRALAQDSDNDTMSDDYETRFQLDPLDPADAALDGDGDGLTNAAEYALGTDPTCADTDRDGWSDGADGAPISRAWLDFGNPLHTQGDLYDYLAPAWFVGARRVAGDWVTNTPSAWHVAASMTQDVGRLVLDVDRSAFSGDLVLDLSFFDHAGATFYMDLLDSNAVIVATNLFGNLARNTGVARQASVVLPFSLHPTAVSAQLRRASGEVTVYTALVYRDADRDGLDDEMEAQLGTDPANPDTDGDGYDDAMEAALPTDPLNPASRPFPAWSHSMKLVLRNFDLATALTDFPALVVLDSSRLDYSQLKAGGADLRFADADGTPLDYEIESWNVSGKSHIWVRIPELADSNRTDHIVMHWGNSEAVDSQNVAGVWKAGYSGVYHLGSGAGVALPDSAVSGRTAHNSGTREIPGAVGSAREFLNPDYVRIPAAAFADIANEITIGLWTYGAESAGTTISYTFLGDHEMGTELFATIPYNGGNVYWAAFGNYDSIVKSAASTPSAYKGAWNYWVFTKNRATGKMETYLNGELWHSGTGKTRVYKPVTEFVLGATTFENWHWNGGIDEFRVATAARPAAWVRMEYRAMTDALLVYGGQRVGVAAAANGAEPSSNGAFTVTRDAVNTNLPLTVAYTVSGSATPGVDYTALSGSVTIPAGSLSECITVAVLDDSRLETSETVILTLAPGNYIVSPFAPSATVTIADDETDTDSDGLSDAWETQHFGNLSRDGTGDFDGDGLTDAQEHAHNCNPALADTDGDGLSDFAEVNTHFTRPDLADTDGDGMPDGWEVTYSLNPLSAADAATDADSDGISNLKEYQFGLNPRSANGDSDGDTLSDADEINLFGANPALADSNSNGTNDAYTVVQKTGVQTSYRYGFWGENGDTVQAQSNFWARLEYSVDFPASDVYRLGVLVTNASPSALATNTLRMQVLVDGTPAGWIKVSVPKTTSVWGYTLTPFIPAGAHTVRLAWLEDVVQTTKLLGITSLVVQRLDAPDSNSDGRQDWVDNRLALGRDSDTEGLADSQEVLDLGTSAISVDTDGDTLSDFEEETLFLTDPLDADSDSDGLNDSYLIDERLGPETSYRRSWWWAGTWEVDGDTLWNNATSGDACYDFTVTNAGMYRLAVQLRNYKADPLDDYVFVVRALVDGHEFGIYSIRADVDRAGRGYLITPWLSVGTHRFQLNWIARITGSGRDTHIAYEKIQFYGVDGVDGNSNGVPDWVERRLQQVGDTDGDGLSDEDEVLIHGTSPVNADTDGDGLSDGEEVALGTNPLNGDSDGDGVGDFQEVRESLTNPLVAEFDGTAVTVDSKTGSQKSASEGNWQIQGTELQSQYRRGYVEYQLTCPTQDIYALRIEATHVWQHSNCAEVVPPDTTDLMIYVDGIYVGKKPLKAADCVYAEVFTLTPNLQAGTHTVRIFWENTHDRIALKIKQLRLQQLGGPDANQNGIKDWVEYYVSQCAGVDVAPAQSVVSPVCMEGTVRYLGLMSASNLLDSAAIPVKSGVLGRWYANVPLSATSATPVEVSFENGGLVVTTNIAWTPLNLLDATNAPAIRAGDSLMLTALPTGATNGTVTVNIAGVTNYTTTVDSPVIHTFATGGSYTVTGAWTDGVNPQQNSLVVAVVSAAFPTSSPACLLGCVRSWSCPGIPSSVVLESDPSVDLSGTNQTPNIRMNKVNREHHLVARIPNGPIVDSIKLNGFWVQAAVDNFMWIVETYPDSKLWEQEMITKWVPASVKFKLQINVGGVTFDDLTTVRYVYPNQLDALGEYKFRMIKPNSVNNSTCHSVYIYDGTTYLGEAYYFGILLPDE